MQSSDYQGTNIRITTAHGYTYRSLLSIDVTNDYLCINWRVYPEKLGVEMAFLKSVEQGVGSEKSLLLKFVDFELPVEFENAETCGIMATCLESLLIESRTIEKEKEIYFQQRRQSQLGIQSVITNQLQSMRQASYLAAVKQEQLYQLVFALKLKESTVLCERIITRSTNRATKSAFSRWAEAIKVSNTPKMKQDKWRWRLHAIANQDCDLQAWYHAVFYQEVYRLRGPFWFRDAILPIYRSSYDLVDNALTPLEEAALAHVLCSPDTSYGDVAGQMFVVQALTSQEQFTLFQTLASQGSHVVKYPRSGRPSRKLFRFSFVEGKIYLTWKGKFGNQGVDLGDVSEVSMGLMSDVLRRTVQFSKADSVFLSIVCAGRSVDLCFDSETERNSWKSLLDTLTNKEHGLLENIESIRPKEEKEDADAAAGEESHGASGTLANIENEELLEWALLYAAVGRGLVPDTVRFKIIRDFALAEGGRIVEEYDS